MPSLPARPRTPDPVPPPAYGKAVGGALVAIAAVAIGVPTLIVLTAPPVAPRRVARAAPQHVVSKAELPPVEPVAYQNLEPSDARSFNASVPFVTGPNPPARPFVLTGDDAARARAIDCMAAAVLYEAGDDPVGQRAVAQVVINRVRHPAFPKTICGVVFQGSERPTGCQFTFTCDGALVRHRWLDVQWTRARATATAALGGKVFSRVGYATHYHTDWVVPYWQSSLDKIAAVETHLFFRWTGWWGTPGAFGRRVSGDEPVIAALAPYSTAHGNGVVLANADGTMQPDMPFFGRLPLPLATDPNVFLTAIDPKQSPDSIRTMAIKACGARPKCRFMAWTDLDAMASFVPARPDQIAAMAFSYMRDAATGYDKALWNCAEYKRAPAQCMKRQMLTKPVAAPDAPAAAATAAQTAAGAPPVASLSGVRRKGEPPVPAPVPTAPAPTTGDAPGAP